MNAVRRFLRRLKASVPGQRDDRRLREELAEHLTLLTDEYMRSGLSRDEARRRAKLRLGAADAITEAYRDEQRLGWLDDLGSDLRYGIRNLWRNPGFGSLAILTLALGIGLNLAIFSVINAVLIRPLPFRHPDELMLIQLLTPEGDRPIPLWCRLTPRSPSPMPFGRAARRLSPSARCASIPLCDVLLWCCSAPSGSCCSSRA